MEVPARGLQAQQAGEGLNLLVGRRHAVIAADRLHDEGGATTVVVPTRRQQRKGGAKRAVILVSRLQREGGAVCTVIQARKLHDEGGSVTDERAREIASAMVWFYI
jgi:mRNA-degrading endonuclease toxin of MazEF toxin-antitoxin module